MERDPSQILLSCRTPAQLAAARELAAAPGYIPLGPALAPGRLDNLRLVIVMPFRDHIELTRTCLQSLARQDLAGISLQVVAVDNGSVAAATSSGLADLSLELAAKGISMTRVVAPGTFNFSLLNNVGVATAQAFTPDYLLFLNNDIEFTEPSQLAKMLAFAEVCPHLGALGCTLLYPSGKVQHLFAAPGIKLVAAHPLKGCRLDRSTSAWFALPRPVAAVTGAALLVSAASFAAVGGFDVELPTLGQDIDLCLKLQKLGLVNWTLPGVQLMHHESATKGGHIAKAEVALMYARWGHFLTDNPYFSRRLSRFSEQPVWAPSWEPQYPWARLL